MPLDGKYTREELDTVNHLVLQEKAEFESSCYVNKQNEVVLVPAGKQPPVDSTLLYRTYNMKGKRHAVFSLVKDVDASVDGEAALLTLEEALALYIKSELVHKPVDYLNVSIREQGSLPYMAVLSGSRKHTVSLFVKMDPVKQAMLIDPKRYLGYDLTGIKNVLREKGMITSDEALVDHYSQRQWTIDLGFNSKDCSEAHAHIQTVRYITKDKSYSASQEEQAALVQQQEPEVSLVKQFRQLFAKGAATQLEEMPEQITQTQGSDIAKALKREGVVTTDEDVALAPPSSARR